MWKDVNWYIIWFYAVFKCLQYVNEIREEISALGSLYKNSLICNEKCFNTADEDYNIENGLDLFFCKTSGYCNQIRLIKYQHFR